MKRSEQINEISKALAAAQGAIQAACKDSTVKHTKFTFKYADWEAIDAVSKDPLKTNELCVLQELINTEKGVGVITFISHSSGQWFEFGPFIIPCGQTPHELGSASSYAKRYAFCAALKIVTSDEDDDAKTVSEAKYVAKPAPCVAPAPKAEPKRDPKDCITKEQFVELKKYWDLCSAAHKNNRIRILNKSPHNCNLLEELPKEIYITELELAKLNAQVNQSNEKKEKDDV